VLLSPAILAEWLISCYHERMFWQHVPMWVRGGIKWTCVTVALMILVNTLFYAQCHQGEDCIDIPLMITMQVIIFPAFVMMQEFPDLYGPAPLYPTLGTYLSQFTLTYLPTLIIVFALGAINAELKERRRRATITPLQNGHGRNAL